MGNRIKETIQICEKDVSYYIGTIDETIELLQSLKDQGATNIDIETTISYDSPSAIMTVTQIVYETDQEMKDRIKSERLAAIQKKKDLEKTRKLMAKQREAEEREQYLRLKNKFENNQ